MTGAIKIGLSNADGDDNASPELVSMRWWHNNSEKYQRLQVVFLFFLLLLLPQKDATLPSDMAPSLTGTQHICRPSRALPPPLSLSLSLTINDVYYTG